MAKRERRLHKGVRPMDRLFIGQWTPIFYELSSIYVCGNK
ncbi:hypothetical protein M2369_001306 [Bacillus sp. JUb11]|nr:hypothetical protein [Bacillus sp. JUb11]